MLNKQVNDPDVAGVGQFVEENFFNLGLADHPLQALNRAARNNPNFRDEGRKEITSRDSDAFKFRTLTLRQLRDGRFFFHNGSLTRVKDVVKYFNAGVPQDPRPPPRARSRPLPVPRGPSSPRGLGLSDHRDRRSHRLPRERPLRSGLREPRSELVDKTLQLNERDLTPRYTSPTSLLSAPTTTWQSAAGRGQQRCLVAA